MPFIIASKPSKAAALSARAKNPQSSNPNGPIHDQSDMKVKPRQQPQGAAMEIVRCDMQSRSPV
jgi:hypothetical protein